MAEQALDQTLKDIVVLAIVSYRNLLLLRIIVSLIESFAQWSPPSWLRPLLSFLYDLTEPFLRIFRGLLPALRLGGMGLDLSPILAFLVLQILLEVALRV